MHAATGSWNVSRRDLVPRVLNLFIIRHAHAVSAEEHPDRPLSERGRADAQRIAAFFRTNGLLRPAQLWHSPLVRARETADLLDQGLLLDAVRVETVGLMPEDDPEVLLGRLAAYPSNHDIALVGHEPHLSALATWLVRDKPKPVFFHLRKGAVLALERTEAVHKQSGLPRWQVRWHFSPELLTRFIASPGSPSVPASPAPSS